MTLPPQPFRLLTCSLALTLGLIFTGTSVAEEASTDRVPRIAGPSLPAAGGLRDEYTSMRLLAQAAPAAPATAPKPGDAAPDAPKPAVPADGAAPAPAVPPGAGAFPGFG